MSVNIWCLPNNMDHGSCSDCIDLRLGDAGIV